MNNMNNNNNQIYKPNTQKTSETEKENMSQIVTKIIQLIRDKHI
jgi:hypothetical protein